MGLIFPIFSSFFTTYKDSTYKLPFSALCVCAGVIVGLISFSIGKITLIPAIQTLNKNFIKLSEGDLTARINIKSNDEVGELAEAFNNFAVTLEKMLIQVEQSSEEVCKFSEYLLSATNMAKRTSEQISQASNVMADGASSQAENVISIQQQIENGFVKTDEGFKKVQEMLMNSKKSSDIATDGSNYMHQVMEQFSWVGKTVAFATESIINLGKRSNEISDFIKIISEISSQTNLLALNASIEAARAGESGKGFAVVAEEISKLASSTTEASKSISDLVTSIQEETNITVKTMESNLEKVDTQIAAIKKGGEALKIILEGVKFNEANAQKLHTIYSEIQNISKNIYKEINNISTVISDNASYSQEIAASTYEQNNEINNIVKESEKLVDLAKALQKQIDKFTINHDISS